MAKKYPSVITKYPPKFEPCCEKTGLWSFKLGATQTGLYSHRIRQEALNFGFRKKRNCTICVVKTKTLISFMVAAKLICVFVFAYAKSRFSHDEAHLIGYSITFSGATYNIPICIWLMDTHPYNPPMVFVKPTSTMQIKQGRNVDSNGKVDLPYLREWRFVSEDLVRRKDRCIFDDI